MIPDRGLLRRVDSVAVSDSVILAVPLLLKGHTIGAISLARTRVAPFDDTQVALVESFADQAVIAIENTRLFDAEQASRRELEESLQLQTATADVLKSISRSTFNLQAVLDTLADSAARLCDADQVAIYRREGDAYRWLASSGLSNEVLALVKEQMIKEPLLPGKGSIVGRAALEGAPVQILDVCADPDYTLTEAQHIAQYRSGMGVPLLREGVPIGAMSLLRTQVMAFTDKQIELAQTFADQAVIAIENTRLFEEVQARTRELVKTVEDLEIASQHKNQFVANMSHELRTPLAAPNSSRKASTSRRDRNLSTLLPASAPTASISWASSIPCSTLPRSNPANSP